MHFSFRNLKYYGFTKEHFYSCYDFMVDGNRNSLRFVLVANSLILLVMTILQGIFDLNLPRTDVFFLISMFVALPYFAFYESVKKYSSLFFYMGFEVMLSYGFYAMSTTTYTSSVLFPAAVVLYPLFYMDNMNRMTSFVSLNVGGYLLVAYVIYPNSDLRMFVYNVVPFSIVSVGLHYIYQTNRVNELTNVRDSIMSKRALEIRSNFETLTRLLRRRTFIDISEKYLTGADDSLMAMVILDIDHFKLINDTYGHQVGDEAIIKIGSVIIETLDIKLSLPSDKTKEINWDEISGNIAGRLGGDEFICLISSEETREDVVRLCEKMIETLNDTSVGPISGIGGSIGVSFVESSDVSYDTLYHEADLALYRAKNKGRNRVIVYSEQDKDADEESKMVEFDALTGLMKMETFKARATDMIKASEAGTYKVAYFDIENFKSYNAKYGFASGDLFLQTVADEISNTYPDGLVSRFADDHFVALISDDDVEHHLGQIRFNIRKYRGDFRAAIRSGIYSVNDISIDINTICDRAKFACDTIRGRYDVNMQFFDEELNKKHERQRYILDHLDNAINNEYIKVYYQPIVRTYTKQCCGFEALSRYIDPDIGMIPPGELIETLEQYRLVYRLDLYVLEEVCKDLVRAAELGRDIVPISVNLSRIDFETCDMVSEIEMIVKGHNVPRNLIEFEITETALSVDEARIVDKIDVLKKAGYNIWVDDFGSGYSSLNTLKNYKYDVIKFDMKFLSDSSKRGRIILTSLVDMAKQLDLHTLAEGVETEEQYRFLKSIGCEMVQGYLFGRPENYRPEQSISDVYNISGIEKSKDRYFYTNVGNVNVLRDISMETDIINQMGDFDNPVAMAIIEFEENNAKILTYSTKFKKVMENFGYGNLDEIISRINNESIDDAHINEIMMMRNRCRYNNNLESIVRKANGEYFIQQWKCIANDEMSGRMAILVVFRNITNTEAGEK